MDPKEDGIKQLATEFSKATDKVKELATDLKGRMDAGEKGLEDLKNQFDEKFSEFNDIKGRFEDAEQKMSRRGQDEGGRTKTIAEQIFENDEFKSLAENPRSGKSIRVAVKDVTSATTDANGSAGALVAPDRQSGILALPEQRLTVRDLIAPGSTNSNSIEYLRETGFTNNAGPQAKEGDLKNESDIKFDDANAPVRTIAHWIRASKQILDDAPMLQSYLEGRMRYGLKLNEDRQLLNGDGTGGNLLGMIPQATAFADPASMTEYTILDQLRLAMLQAVLAEYPASGHILNPIDWARIEMTKDTIGRYIIGDPQGSANPRLWNLPVVDTTAMAQGKFLTGAFNLAAQVFDRMQAAVIISTEDRDNFIRNMVTLLVEERLALAVYRPEALIYGTLTAKVAP
ncbi:phage major capsid protein [Psychrobacter sanguinis]|uniref:phage major capsid protein n=1 Tax=Psychrobacter sanguinis TaxID=861445 RepID=UPI0028A2820A|nr:phage major capsid protein [Psychrobacter sanguinis]